MTKVVVKTASKVKVDMTTSKVFKYLSVVSLLVPAHSVIDFMLCPYSCEVPPALEVDPVLVETIHL